MWQELEQVYRNWSNETLSGDWHVEIQKVYEKEKVGFRTYLLNDLQEFINKIDHDKISFWLVVVSMIYPFESEIEGATVVELLCNLIEAMLNGVEEMEREEVYQRINHIYWAEDIIVHYIDIPEANVERVAEVLAGVCRLDYRKEKWANNDYSDRFDAFYLIVYKALWILTGMEDNQTAFEAIKECLHHFDKRIVFDAKAYFDSLNDSMQ